jgi:hypothetical protein
MTIHRTGSRRPRHEFHAVVWLIGAALASVAPAIDANDSGSSPPSIISLEEWAGPNRPPSRPDQLKAHSCGIRSIVIHHSETPAGTLFDERTRLRAIRHYHLRERQWGEVAYHFFIGSDGTIYQGRDERFQGDSGTKYDLDGRLLICLLGDFKSTAPTDEALAALVRFLDEKRAEHSVSPESIVTHREVAETDCPGDALQKWFESLGRHRFRSPSEAAGNPCAGQGSKHPSEGNGEPNP